MSTPAPLCAAVEVALNRYLSLDAGALDGLRELQDRSGGDTAGTSRSRSRSPGGSRPPRSRFDRADRDEEDVEEDDADSDLLAILNDKEAMYGMD